uniref:Pentatricopeptide repeat-containing protein n=1 Tax=Brassica oleracea var. oleracea TaxID=109376 RepID=A0A0D3E2L8_BRAOL
MAVLVDGGRKRDGEVVIWNVMIDNYMRLGDCKAVRTLFDQMSVRSIVSWNTMISGYCKNGAFKEVVEIFCEMRRVDLRPSYVTLVSVLPAVSRIGSLELGEWLHSYAESKGIKIDDVLGSALIDMYSKCGVVERAVVVFERLPRKNVLEYHMEFLETFGCIWSSKEVIKVIIGRTECWERLHEVAVIPLPERLARATIQGRSRFHGETTPDEARSDVLRATQPGRSRGDDPGATSSERHSQVAREETTRERRLRSDTARSLARRRPGSDVFGATQPGRSRGDDPGATSSERHSQVAREETTRERRLRSDTARSLARRRPGSDVFGATQPGRSRGDDPGATSSERHSQVAREETTRERRLRSDTARWGGESCDYDLGAMKKEKK